MFTVSAEQKDEVVFIGAGNVATNLSFTMQEAGFSIVQIYSRSINSAQTLAEKLKCGYTTNLKEITTEADLYIFAISDDALHNVLDTMRADTVLQSNTCTNQSNDDCTTIPASSGKGIWIHTSGSLPMDVFSGISDSYGILYPLQTISKQRKADFSKVPLFIEGNTAGVETAIRDIAVRLSENVTVLSSDKRRYLHLAAVFACNFSNHLFTVASQILEKQDIDWRVLLPLIDETANKLYSMHPGQAQTGPAIRGDRTIMELHKSLLDDESLCQLYEMISESIHSQTINKGQR